MSNLDLSFDTLRILARNPGAPLAALETDADARGAATELRVKLKLQQVRGAVGGLPEDALTALEAIDAREVLATEPAALLRQAVAGSRLQDAARDRALGQIEAAETDGAFGVLEAGDALEEVALADRPDLADLAETTATLRIGMVAGLDDRALQTMLGRARAPAALTEQRIGHLVIDGAIDEPAGRRLGAATALYHALDEDADGAAALLERGVVEDGTRPVTMREILRLDDAEVARLIGPSETLGLSAEARAHRLRQRIETVYPLEGLAARAAVPSPETLARIVEPAAEVLRAAPDVLRTWRTDDTALDAPTRDAVQALARTVNAYPGLGLDTIATSEGDPAERAARIGARIERFDRFLARNADADPLKLDFMPGSKDLDALDFSDMDEEEMAETLAAVQARTRMARLLPVETAARVMSVGYHSAVAIADEEVDVFAARTGLDEETARDVHNRATDRLSEVSSAVAAVIDLERYATVAPFEFNPDAISPAFEIFVPEDVTDGLKRLPGYQRLFGSQNFCDCAHCDSVLSPAAYFVDLMRFIQTKVTSKEFTGARAGHAMQLNVRRPDLWTTPLTCAHTHTLVPTLDLVNEILASAIARRSDPTIDPGNASAIYARVYETLLPAERRSFVTPVDLRISTADAHLTAFDTSRAALLALADPGASAERRVAVGLQVNAVCVDLIVSPGEDWTFLSALFRHDFEHAGDTAQAFNAERLREGLGVDRKTLGAIAETRFVTDDGALAFTIRAERRDANDSIQNDIERVRGLTLAALARMHRFERLRRALDWDVRALDGVLDRVGRALGIDDVAWVLRLRDLADRLGLPLDEALSLTGAIPTEHLVDAASDDAPALRDRLFNVPRLAPDQVAMPNAGVRFVHPAFRDDATLPNPADPNRTLLQRLQLGLRLADEALVALLRALAPAMGADPEAADEAARGFLLTADNLALLHRHALLMRKTRLESDALVAAIRIATGGNAVTDLDQVEALLDFLDWLGDSPYDLARVAALSFVPHSGAETAPDTEALTAEIRAEVARSGALTLAPTVFAYLDGVTEEASRAIVAANEGLFETVSADALRLRADTPLPVPLAPPAGGFPAGVAVADLEAALAPFHPSTVLDAALAAALNIDASHLRALLAAGGVSLDTPAIRAALTGEETAPLEAALADLVPALLHFDLPGVTAAHIDFVGTNRALFDADDLAASASLERLMRLVTYVALTATEDGAPDPERRALVEAVLLDHAPGTAFSAADGTDLARAVRADPAGIRILEAALALDGNAVAALGQLAQTVAKIRALGLDASTFALLVSPQDTALTEATEGLVSLLRRRLPDDASFDAVVEQIEDRLRGRRRDALVDYHIRRSAGRFQDVQDLYAYYLIDPAWEGCGRTSRLIAGTGSLLTYVHRIVQNLEQDRRAPDAADHVHISPARIPKDEWDWRKNYRVWEANRKVFLWPHNYMEPSLRDNRTELFKTLEESLLSRDVTEQSVLEAYSEYMRGFEEIAGLRIAGAYHEEALKEGRDVLHIFGCTEADPPEYYYWTVENLIFSKLDDRQRLTFSERRKIDAKIGARDVGAIIFNERLYLFWSEITTSDWSRIRNGESEFRGYKHRLRLKYTYLQLDGHWAAPQELTLRGSTPFKSAGWLMDPLSPKEAGSSAVRTPLYSDRIDIHEEFLEYYTLRAPAARKVYPAIARGKLYLSVGTRNAVWEVDLFERVATRPDSPTRGYLRSVWEGMRDIYHVRTPHRTRRIYFQTANAAATDMSAPLNAVSDIASSWTSLSLNTIGSGWNAAARDARVVAFDLDLPANTPSIARLNDSTARIFTLNSGWGLPNLLLQKGPDALLLTQSFGGPRARAHEGRRLGTTLIPDMSRALFYGGVDALLDVKTQEGLKEAAHLISPVNAKVRLRGTTKGVDYTGPLGVYYREIFFHIPALLAAHLNAKGRYEAAARWYAYIFDPTAPFDASVDLASLTRRQRRQADRDRVWRYLEFRGMRPEKMRNVLTDHSALEAYRRDPFNPYAIGRLRMSEFQKNIFARSLQNRLDLADGLFRQFTRESIDEARVHYGIVKELLGRRPVDVGDCGEGVVRPRTYERIEPHLDGTSDFLIEAETIFWPKYDFVGATDIVARHRYVEFDREGVRNADIRLGIETVMHPAIRRGTIRPPTQADERARIEAGNHELMFDDDPTVRELLATPDAPEIVLENDFETTSRTRSALATMDLRSRAPSEPRDRPGVMSGWTRVATGGWGTGGRVSGPAARGDFEAADASALGPQTSARFAISILRQVGPVFCVPHNEELLALWDRVEDRLWKIHNCRNLDGERQELPLLASEIDPRDLVRAKAEGLSLTDVLGTGAGNLPPYRFTFIIAKAREYAALCAGFGAKVKSGIDAVDLEELTRLRSTQGLNILNHVTRSFEDEVKVAEETLAELEQRKDAVTYRRDHVDGQEKQGLNAWERTNQVASHTALATGLLGSVFAAASGTVHLLPQLGSPFALKYGGKEIGDSLHKIALGFDIASSLSDMVSRAAALEATYARRSTEWKHKVALDDRELKQIDRKIAAASLRVGIARRNLTRHRKSIAQAQEIADFHEAKFSNLGRLASLSTQLQTTYRQIYAAAMSMARLAETTYRFERPDDDAPLLAANYWRADQMGLLAGESLSADLVEMERRYLETNYRELEVEQPFSLMRIAPAQLLALRETGECVFTVRELDCDMLYPGHYRRLIRAVRLSIACVTGPHVNVPATLTLEDSAIRLDPLATGPAGLTAKALRHTTSIATSTAQNDGGVFSFGYSDARYMPFEGAGVVESRWRIRLPASFPPFDYASINDAVLHISYTARFDGRLRDHVEADNAALEGAIAQHLADTPTPRVLSLRQEGSAVFHQVVADPVGRPALLRLDDRVLPPELRTRHSVTRALLLVRLADGASAAGLEITLNGQALTGFIARPDFAGYLGVDAMPALAAGLLGDHQIAITDPGDLAPQDPEALGALDPALIEDIVLVVEAVRPAA